MAFGSFEGLYTFLEVSQIYGMDSSTLRKQVARERLIDGVDIKKFGKVWLITEQSMIKHFGRLKFEVYQDKLKAKRYRDERKKKKLQEKEDCFLDEVVVTCDSWVDDGACDGVELKKFDFSTCDNE